VCVYPSRRVLLLHDDEGATGTFFAQRA